MTVRTRQELLSAISARGVPLAVEQCFRDLIDSLLPSMDQQSPEHIIDAADYLMVVKADGTQQLVLAENVLGGWKDLEMAVVGAAQGAGTPSLQPFGPTGRIKQTRFAVGDSVYQAGHVKHDIKVGSTMYPHVHWSTGGTSTNTVKWRLHYTVAKGHNQENFAADVTIDLEEAAQGTTWRHMITEDATGIAAPEVDSLIILELERIANGGAENADNVFGLYVDWHYDSQQIGTQSRTPDFYT